jgi:hypothetical protein
MLLEEFMRDIDPCKKGVDWVVGERNASTFRAFWEDADPEGYLNYLWVFSRERLFSREQVLHMMFYIMGRNNIPVKRLITSFHRHDERMAVEGMARLIGGQSMSDRYCYQALVVFYQILYREIGRKRARNEVVEYITGFDCPIEG